MVKKTEKYVIGGKQGYFKWLCKIGPILLLKIKKLCSAFGSRCQIEQYGSVFLNMPHLTIFTMKCLLGRLNP